MERATGIEPAVPVWKIAYAGGCRPGETAGYAFPGRSPVFPVGGCSIGHAEGAWGFLTRSLTSGAPKFALDRGRLSRRL